MKRFLLLLGAILLSAFGIWYCFYLCSNADFQSGYIGITATYFALVIVGFIVSKIEKNLVDSSIDAIESITDAMVTIFLIIRIIFGVLGAIAVSLYNFNYFEYADKIEKCVIETNAVVRDVVKTEEDSYIIVCYTDADNVQQRAVIDTRDKMTYLVDDVVSIKYDPANPTKVIASHLTKETTLAELEGTTINPRLVNSEV